MPTSRATVCRPSLMHASDRSRSHGKWYLAHRKVCRVACARSLCSSRSARIRGTQKSRQGWRLFIPTGCSKPHRNHQLVPKRGTNTSLFINDINGCMCRLCAAAHPSEGTKTMSTICKEGKHFRAQVTRHGRRTSKTLPTEALALAWAEREEGRVGGLPAIRQALEDHRIAFVLPQRFKDATSPRF